MYPNHLQSKATQPRIKLPDHLAPARTNQAILVFPIDTIPRIPSSAVSKSEPPKAQATVRLPPLPTTFRNFAIAVFQPPQPPALVPPSRVGIQNQTPAPAQTCRSPSWAERVLASKDMILGAGAGSSQEEPTKQQIEEATVPIASTSALSVRLTSAMATFMSSEDVQELLAWTTEPIIDAPKRIFKRRHARARANAKRIRKKLESQVADFFSEAIDFRAQQAFDAVRSKRSGQKFEQRTVAVMNAVSSSVKESRKRARKRARKLTKDFAL